MRRRVCPVSIPGGMRTSSVLPSGRVRVGLSAASGSGPVGVLRFILDLAFNLLLLSVVVRVVAGWLGAGRHTRWSRPFYAATDWLIEPIRRRLPPIGMIDLSPLAAYVLILIARYLVFSALR